MNVRKFRFLRQKSWFGKLIRLPFRIIPSRAVIKIMSGTLQGKRWIKGSHNLSILFGTYEKSQSKLFFDVSSNVSGLWDLGAHVGYYSLLYRTANATGRISAFEPLPKNAALFQQHMALNNVNGVTLHTVAVSDEVGTLTFNTGKTSVAGKLANDGNLEVDVIRLSEWVKENKIDIPGMIKMDIEGAEQNVLKDIEPILRQYRPKIFLSTHGAAVHEKCLSILRGIGYQIKPLDSNDITTCRELLAS